MAPTNLGEWLSPVSTCTHELFQLCNIDHKVNRIAAHGLQGGNRVHRLITHDPCSCPGLSPLAVAIGNPIAWAGMAMVVPL